MHAEYEFRCSIPQGDNLVRVVEALSREKSAGKSEIRDLDDALSAQEYVAALDISMKYGPLVKVSDALEDLPHDALDVLPLKLYPRIYDAMQVMRHELENEEH
jgi:hypothetical protein